MNCYIFDIDGTLANGLHRTHHLEKRPKDWDAFFAEQNKDGLYVHVANVARALHRGGHRIVICTGRPENYREVTMNWLHLRAVPYEALYMRPAGDFRDDDIIKIEMLARIRADGYVPVMVFDDRDRVVRAWRAAGIPCAQVAEGDF